MYRADVPVFVMRFFAFLDGHYQFTRQLMIVSCTAWDKVRQGIDLATLPRIVMVPL